MHFRLFPSSDWCQPVRIEYSQQVTGSLRETAVLYLRTWCLLSQIVSAVGGAAVSPRLEVPFSSLWTGFCSEAPCRSHARKQYAAPPTAAPSSSPQTDRHLCPGGGHLSSGVWQPRSSPDCRRRPRLFPASSRGVLSRGGLGVLPGHRVDCEGSGLESRPGWSVATLLSPGHYPQGLENKSRCRARRLVICIGRDLRLA